MALFKCDTVRKKVKKHKIIHRWGYIKTVVITESACVFDFEILKLFKQTDFNVVICDVTKKVYNILGDYPKIIANYIVSRIIKNKRNFAKIVWLTIVRAFGRFLTYGFKKNKRDFFKNAEEK